MVLYLFFIIIFYLYLKIKDRDVANATLIHQTEFLVIPKRLSDTIIDADGGTRGFAQAEKKNSRCGPKRPRTDFATRVEHLSDTLGPVGPLFFHRFRLGKHGFNRCFTRSVPGTGFSIWDAQWLWHPSCGPREERREREKEREGEKERKGTGAWDGVTERGGRGGEPGIHAPRLRAHFACQAQFRLGPETLELSLFGVAVYGRHYLDRPRVGLNDLFVCTFYFIGRRLLRDT